MPPTSPTPTPPNVFTLKHTAPAEERRLLRHAEIRVAADAGKAKVISGHAFVYDQVSEELGYFQEVIRPGAATDTLKTADVRCLFNHNADLVLGRTKPKTLRLFDEAKGLRFECDLPETKAAADLAVSIDRGDVDQCSFGFRTLEDRWTYYDGDKPPLRELLKIELYDVSPVTFPAYPQTDVALRTYRSACEEAARRDPRLAARVRELQLASMEFEIGP